MTQAIKNSSPVMITLAQIKAAHPCAPGWKAILIGQGKTAPDDVEFPLIDAFLSNSITDVIWALRCIDRKDISVDFAQFCASRAKISAANAAANAYAAAAAAANAAAYAAAAAAYAAAAAAAAANAAAYAAAAAANAAAYSAYSAYSAYAAAAAAAAADAARLKEREIQKEYLIQLLS